jgi:hypothetical protein
MPTRTTFDEQYISLSSSSRSSLHSYFNSSLLGPNNLRCTLFCNTLSVCSSFKDSEKLSHPYKTLLLLLLLLRIINFYESIGWREIKIFLWQTIYYLDTS